MPSKKRKLLVWFSIIAVIMVLWGLIFAFFGLDILPVISKNVLLSWESALYGAIMTGWGITLLLSGRIAFRRNDTELMKVLLCGLSVWLAIEAAFSAYLQVWFNVGVDIVVFALFAIPLLAGILRKEAKSR